MLHLDNLLSELSTLEEEEKREQERIEREQAEKKQKESLRTEKQATHWRNEQQLQARREQNKRYREKQKRILADLSVETGLDPKLADGRIRRISIKQIIVGRK